MTRKHADRAPTDDPRRLRDERLTFWLAGAATVAITMTATWLVGGGAVIAGIVGVLVALAVLGCALWRAAEDRQDARQSLGTGLLVSVIVAGAVGSAQLAIEHRQASLDNTRAEKAKLIAERESLRVTLGVQPSLVSVDLRGRDLHDFYLARKPLVRALLTGANLRKANLERAKLGDADLRSADLRGAMLLGADLSSAKLVSTNLRGANLNGADLRGADLTGILVKGAELGANFRKQDLHGRDLSGWNLRGADMGGADLTAVKLNGAILDGANLSTAELAGADFSGARIGTATLWPPCVDPPPGPVVPARWVPAVCGPSRTK
jgi:uncharacterized protein YjbI with pentapeptide repeats